MKNFDIFVIPVSIWDNFIQNISIISSSKTTRNPTFSLLTP